MHPSVSYLIVSLLCFINNKRNKHTKNVSIFYSMPDFQLRQWLTFRIAQIRLFVLRHTTNVGNLSYIVNTHRFRSPHTNK